jgi:hypothetical protein
MTILLSTLLFCKTILSQEHQQESNPMGEMTRVSLGIKFEGETLDLKQAIYMDTNRYYIPLNEIISALNGKCSLLDHTILLEVANLERSINTDTNLISADGKQIKLRKNIIINDGNMYISMIDFCRLLNLKTAWDIEHKVISFYFNRDNLSPNKSPATGKPALIRLEDISASHLYNQPEALEKLRIIADYLYSENVPFHIAWVPKYIDPRPSSLLDNDLSQQNSILNADFVYTLDYLLDKNGLIGLHGYTHQYEDTVSLCGTEFHLSPNDGIPATNQYVQERIDLAFSTADKLDIPVSFFEVPHYAIALDELEVLEENFNILYQSYPGEPDKIVHVKNSDHEIKYVPTPLNYVNGRKDLPAMIQRVEDLADGALASFYYHPFLEFGEIEISKASDGYPMSTYNETSTLHELIQLFKEKGYKFVNIYNVN